MGEGPRFVTWTPAARDCLDEIINSISEDSPDAAQRVLEVVLAAAESLSLFAERGRRVPETESETIREIFVYRYRLMYQVASSEVRILAVLHGAMDFDRWIRRGEQAVKSDASADRLRGEIGERASRNRRGGAGSGRA
jgi:plasmid stabilization system protein ParE